MRKWNGPRRYGGPWYGIDQQRILFENGVRKYYPFFTGITRSSGSKAGRLYQFDIEVPDYEARRVEIFFPREAPNFVKIVADGPTCSPHRYKENELCIWHPDDPKENRWVREDGLLHLLRLIQMHLFREAWFRETGKWCGPEFEHANYEPNGAGLAAELVNSG